MTHIQSIKYRCFTYYSSRSSNQFKRNFVSGRSEAVSSASPQRVENFGTGSYWRDNKRTKVNGRLA